jgi:hypothetical protein
MAQKKDKFHKQRGIAFYAFLNEQRKKSQKIFFLFADLTLEREK